MPIIQRIFLIGCFLFLLALPGCGGESAGSETLSEETILDEVQGAPSPPRVKMPQGPPPKKLVIEDLKVGEGIEIEKHEDFTANYVDFDYETGEKLEEVWNPDPFTWSWGNNEMVDALELGLKGMRVGGIRKLIVPSHLAYDNGARVYLVELLEVF